MTKRRLVTVVFDRHLMSLGIRKNSLRPKTIHIAVTVTTISAGGNAKKGKILMGYVREL